MDVSHFSHLSNKRLILISTAELDNLAPLGSASQSTLPKVTSSQYLTTRLVDLLETYYKWPWCLNRLARRPAYLQSD